MNPRQRFQRIMHFAQPDRLPLWDLEGFAEQAIRLWCQQGFPLGTTPQLYFPFDHRLLADSVRLDVDPIPNFMPRKVAEDGEWVTTIDRYGFKVKTLKLQAVSPRAYYYVGGLVKSWSDWEMLKRRYDPRDPRRYPKSWSEDFVAHSRTTDGPFGLFLYWGPGRASKNGYTLGWEEFLVALYDQPDLIHAMFSFWGEFLIELLREMMERAQIDYVFLSDDGVAFKHKALVSPETYRRFWLPYQTKVTDFLRGARC